MSSDLFKVGSSASVFPVVLISIARSATLLWLHEIIFVRFVILSLHRADDSDVRAKLATRDLPE